MDRAICCVVYGGLDKSQAVIVTCRLRIGVPATRSGIALRFITSSHGRTVGIVWESVWIS